MAPPSRKYIRPCDDSLTAMVMHDVQRYLDRRSGINQLSEYPVD